MKYKKEKNYWQQDIRKKEYVRIIFEGVFLVLLISYVFYGTVLAFVLLWPISIGYFRLRKAELIKQKQVLFQQQFKNAIQSISAALNVGYSAENAMKEAYKELQVLYRKDERILKEFRYMIHQLEMNMALEGILLEFAKRTKDEEVQTFGTVFSMAKRSGGDIIAVIRSAISRMTDKMDMVREMETVIAAKKELHTEFLFCFPPHIATGSFLRVIR